MRLRPLLAVLAALAVTPSAHAEGGAYELRFQFEQNGTASAHTFVLKWNGPDSNLQSITVLANATNLPIQTLQFPADKVHLVWHDLVAKSNQVKDKIADFIDFNFDKYGDFRLTRSWPYQAGGKYYLIWLFDNKKNQYAFSQELSDLPAPVVDDKAKRIVSMKLGAYGGGEYVENSFSITEAGKLHVESRITQKIDNPEDLSFVREVRARVEGEFQRICRIEVPAEGKLKRIWGDPSRCAPYLRKQAPNLYQTADDQSPKPKAKAAAKASDDSKADDAIDLGDDKTGSDDASEPAH